MLNIRILPLFLRSFLPLCALVFFGLYFYVRTEVERDLTRIRGEETLHVGLGAGTLTGHIENISRDLIFLASHSAMRAAVNNPTPNNLAHLAEDFSNFSHRKRIYDQVRWLDETGMELVRVDYIQGRPKIIPAEKLQDKGKRYFFTDSFKLQPGEIFISPLDLNIEQNTIEIPYKPMVRVATPVIDDQGRKRGIVILNYFGREMLEAFATATRGIADHIMVVNGEGYWLKSPQPADELGFMFKRPELSLASRSPEAWEHIRVTDTGQVHLRDGLWTWQTVYPLLAGQHSSTGAAEAFAPSRGQIETERYVWKSVAWRPDSVVDASTRSVSTGLLPIGLLILSALGLGSWLVASRTAALRLSELKFHTIADFSEDWETWIDHQGRYLYCSPSCEKITGHPAEAFVARPELFLEIAHPEDREDLRNHLAQHGRTIGSEEFTFRIVLSNGQIRYLEHACRQVTGALGELLGRRASNRDITTRKEMEVQLKEARALAEAANQAKSIFLAHMSHEIRTPMNAVLGFAQLLERDPSLSPPARNKVATIMKSGDHLLAIINDILELSRIAAGRVDVKTEPLDLHGLLDDLVVMFRMRAEEKELAFTLDSAPELPRYIVTDLGKLRQVLINLLGNAVKFTKAGSITLSAFSIDSGRVAIEVQDSGIGITPDEQTKLFHPFVRTKSGEQAAGGTGLGLVISREYAHLLGGEITVTSRTDEGSCFRFEFHAPLSSEVPVVTETARRVIALSPGQRKIQILVVDDIDTNRELLRGMLEPLGFIVAEAADGKEAIEKANALKPRIVLMDQVMPGMDGVEATRILRTSYAKELLAIIGISASALAEEKQQFLDSGLNAYIAKPFREQELHDALAKHAGVLFESKEFAPVSMESGSSQPIPTLEKMPPEWREAFNEALAMKNITRIRALGEAAQEVDPQLSAWILARVARYDLKSLMALDIYGSNGANNE